MTINQPHPTVRVVSVLMATVGVFFLHELKPLAAALALAWLLLFITRVIKPHIKFLVVIVLPVALALAVVWIWLVGAPPGEPLRSDPIGGFVFAMTITLRLALLGGIWQLGLLTIPREKIIENLRSIGVGKSGIAVACGIVSVVPELALRTRQILVARYARGLMVDRTYFGKALQLPYLLRPLVVWAIRVAVERADSWRQKSLLDNLYRMLSDNGVYSLVSSIIVAILGLAVPIYVVIFG